MEGILVLLFSFAYGEAGDLCFADLKTTFNVYQSVRVLEVEAVPRTLTGQGPGTIINDDYKGEKIYFNLDAPVRQTAYFLSMLDRKRDQVFKGGLTEPFPLLSYRFIMSLRSLAGRELALERYDVNLLLSEKPGFVVLECNEQREVFPADLQNTVDYERFLSRLIMPRGPLRFPFESQEPFVVDLYYQWPKVDKRYQDLRIKTAWFSPVLSVNPLVTSVKVHLGSTYCEFDAAGKPAAHSSEFLHFAEGIYAESAKIPNIVTREGADAAIEILIRQIEAAPAHPETLKTLLDLYIQRNRHQEGLALVNRFRTLFEELLRGSGRLALLEQKERARKDRILAQWQTFKKDDNLSLQLLTPKPNDVMGRDAELHYELIGNKSKLLRLDVFINDRAIAQVNDPGDSVRIKAPFSRFKQRLKLVALLENRTYQEVELPVRVMNIDDLTSVHLMGIRAVVTRDNATFDAHLQRDDFVIRENGEQLKFHNFRKEQEPLRVAVLIDSSTSMKGEKLYQAQYAVKTFLEKLEAEDRVAVYAFAERVFRLSDFTSDHQRVIPRLYSLSPQLSTSLHDAIYVAHEALLAQKGIRVMIILSDGADTASAVKPDALLEILKDSPVMAYPILLNLNEEDLEAKKGNQFLRQVAEATGSVTMEAPKAKQLSSSFDRIYNEMKSFYYLECYPRASEPDIHQMNLKVKKRGARARLRLYNANGGAIPW